MKQNIFLATIIFFVLGCSHKNSPEVDQSIEKGQGYIKSLSTDLIMNQFIDSLLNEMTLTEKLGQMNLPTSGDITTGSSKSSNVAEKIREGKVGGLFNIKGVEKIKEVQRIAVEESRLGIPLIFAMDVIHGYESVFPIPLGLASSWDMELIKQSAQTAAAEATADGISWAFSPMVDLSRDARWGRIAEGAGEDPYLGAEIAKAMVQGYQGEDLRDKTTMMSCFKHFALYGASEGGRDYNTVDMSRVRMYNEYFLPYKAAVDAGAGSVMTAFNEVDGIPASGNKWLFTDVLRKEWGFDGFVVTDYEAIKEMIAHGMGDMQHVAVLALKAGIDMDMVDEAFPKTLEKSLEEGKVTMPEINTAVRRILEAKYKLGLFEDPYKYCDVVRAKREVYSVENRRKARNTAAQSMVLMKNENQVLPLKKSQKVALIGPLADAANNMPGTWAVAARHSEAISMKMAFDNYLDDYLLAQGSNVDYDKDLFHLYTYHGKKPVWDERQPEQIIQEAVAIAHQSDVIVAAVGETSEMSGEASSRTNIQIPQAQKDLLSALYKTGKPVVIVLFTGRPLDITEEAKHADAILNVWYPGSEAGNAIYDVVFGEVNPAAKTTVSFPRNIGQVPIFYNYKNTGRPLRAESEEDCNFEKFKTAYLDECNTPLFPFGYGLSYTTFEYGDIQISSNSLSKTGSLTASVEVTNTGNYDGNETVQLYIRDMVGSITRPVKELKGFQKVMIPKGEARTVSFTITEENLKFYNYDLDFVSEPGDFEVFIGPHSATKNKTTFTLSH